MKKPKYCNVNQFVQVITSFNYERRALYPKLARKLEIQTLKASI